jgi:predicted MFS family arabinose efflux permease
MKHPSRAANRWWIVFGATISMLVAQGPVIIFTLGVFIGPISEEFGWDRANISLAGGAAGLCSALTVPIVGVLMDRWGVRRVLIPAILAFSASMALIAISPNSLPAFLALYAIAGIAGSGQGPLGYAKSVASWFDDKRGLALGVTMAGIGIGAALMPQYAQFLIATFGWRAAYLGLGAVITIVALPSVLFFIRDPQVAPASFGPADRPSLQTLPGHDVSEALNDYRFWLLAIVLLIVSVVTNGVVVHTVPILTDHGYAPSQAAALMIAVGLSTMAGRLLSGYLVDNIFAPYVAAFFFLLPSLGLFFLGSATYPLLGIVSIGLASGTEVDMIAFLTSRYFGLKRFGQLYGLLFAIFTAGPAIGPYMMGLSFVRLHSYAPALIAFSLALGAAAILVLCLGPYKYPAKNLDETQAHGHEEVTATPLQHRPQA